MCIVRETWKGGDYYRSVFDKRGNGGPEECTGALLHIDSEVRPQVSRLLEGGVRGVQVKNPWLRQFPSWPSG